MLAFEPFAALALELCEYETDTDELFDTEVLLDKPVVELVLVELLALPELPFAGRLRGRGIRSSARRARGTGAGSTTSGARRGLVAVGSDAVGLHARLGGGGVLVDAGLARGNRSLAIAFAVPLPARADPVNAATPMASKRPPVRLAIRLVSSFLSSVS
ncbi:MAG: hypothetical protein H0W90_12060 [Actinobacteria bacterium]|nr:hypothetical protein [Actinomycetota bacterium]